MAAGDLRQMSLEEYLPLDRASDEKREYAFNEAFAMEARVEHRQRTDDGRWVITYSAWGDFPLESCGVTLAFDDASANLDRVEP